MTTDTTANRATPLQHQSSLQQDTRTSAARKKKGLLRSQDIIGGYELDGNLKSSSSVSFEETYSWIPTGLGIDKVCLPIHPT